MVVGVTAAEASLAASISSSSVARALGAAALALVTMVAAVGLLEGLDELAEFLGHGAGVRDSGGWATGGWRAG